MKDGSVVVNRDWLQKQVIEIFVRLGVSREDAEDVARVLICADQWGVSSHGVLRVERYVRCLQSGGILANAELTVEQKSGGWVRATANGGLGIPASSKATALAIKLAKEHGISVVNLRQSHHNGAEGVYADEIARQGMVGVVMSTGNPIMAVTGSCEATIGNNPFAYAVPAGKYGILMMDVAMSAVADGKIQLARATGKQLPPGCILDKDGKPSVEPEEYLNGGALLPFGAHKGYGLSVMVECLAGILSGAALTHDINSWNETPGKCGNAGHLIIAMDIGKMMPVEVFEQSVETMIEQFKSAKRAEGVEEIYYPGELEHRRMAEAGDKVMIIPSTWASLCRAAESVGLAMKNE